MATPLREKIIEAALERFAASGVLGASMSDIRRAAGVSVGAVYHHFADKQALADAAWLHALADYQDGFLAVLANHPDPDGGVRTIVAFHLQWVQRNRGAAALLFAGRPTGPAAAAELAERNRAFFDKVLIWWRAHAHHGALRDLDRALINALWIGPAQEYCRHWLAGRSSRIPPVVVRALADAAWLSLRGPAAEPRDTTSPAERGRGPDGGREGAPDDGPDGGRDGGPARRPEGGFEGGPLGGSDGGPGSDQEMGQELGPGTGRERGKG